MLMGCRGKTRLASFSNAIDGAALISVASAESIILVMRLDQPAGKRRSGVYEIVAASIAEGCEGNAEIISA
jgi:hypothetical protein